VSQKRKEVGPSTWKPVIENWNYNLGTNKLRSER
jgi:hypothetical protein